MIGLLRNGYPLKDHKLSGIKFEVEDRGSAREDKRTERFE